MDNANQKTYLAVSTFSTKGDGYTNYFVPILEELVKRGHIVLGYGISYDRLQHSWNFGLCNAPYDKVTQIIASITNGIKVDGVLVAIDIPQQVAWFNHLKTVPKKSPYIAFTAVEADPLSSKWAMTLMEMDRVFTISQFGADECNKHGVDAIHLPATLNLNTFTMKTRDEQQELKKALGLENKTVFFVNADGNERKNISVVFEAMQLLKEVRNDFYLILLTRESPVSWDFNELKKSTGTSDYVSIMQRGLSAEEVARLYRASDFLLNPSKAEGLGMPLLEAQASGTPVIATGVTGMAENLSDGKGIILTPDFRIIDVFGNGYRYFVSKEQLFKTMIDVMNNLDSNPDYYVEMTQKARLEIEKRNIKDVVNLLEKTLNE